MFPSSEDEIRKLKEESLILRNKRPGELPEALQRLYMDMSIERPVPEATELDLTSMDADELINEMRDKYRVIISTTVKSVKTL